MPEIVFHFHQTFNRAIISISKHPWSMVLRVICTYLCVRMIRAEQLPMDSSLHQIGTRKKNLCQVRVCGGGGGVFGGPSGRLASRPKGLCGLPGEHVYTKQGCPHLAKVVSQAGAGL